MSTYKELPAYKDLLKKISLDGGRIIGFVGSGLSKAGGLPDWTGLRDKILSDYRTEAEIVEEHEKKRILNACSHAKGIDELWNSFSEIKKIRPKPVFEASVRRHLGNSEKNGAPPNYRRLWQMGVEGIITLNLDDFAQRAYSEVKSGHSLLSFTGFQIKNYVDVLSQDVPFLCNLHGRLAETDSWVFSIDDHRELKSITGFKEFFDTCFLTASILFIGISAEDVGAGGLLSELLKSIRRTIVGDHYWISDRSDTAASQFADANGLKRIHYCSKDNHAELDSILEDLRNKKFQMPLADVVVPAGKKVRNFVRMPVQEMLGIADPNELRIKLNDIATNILQSGSSDRFKDYNNFVNEYEMLISRAWFIPKCAKAKFFDYDLRRLISGDGAFGKVYEALDNKGNTCAIKIIHDDVHGDHEMLEAFRRGVSSMKIVAKQGVPGVVAIRDAWEMPASIVMNYIDGLNLEQSVEDRVIDDWGDRLTIFENLANVLLRAHRLPEVVVHRDVRPPNVILEGLNSKGDSFTVSLVDFDLSWHRDAFGKSVQHRSNLHGYFAPEQYIATPNSTSRSALVDSYGLAMTMFYVVTGRHPRFGETERADWEKDLFQSFRIARCESWKSIPTRLARLVYRGSIVEQAKRADMTTMLRELRWLSLLYNSDKIEDIRLVIDEIGHRSEVLRGAYEWDEQDGHAKYASPSGLSIHIRRIERFGIELRGEWRNDGDAQYRSVKKYIDGSTKDILSKLRSSRWKCELDANFDGMSVVATKTVVLPKLSKSDIEGFAGDVDFLAARLSFRG